MWLDTARFYCDKSCEIARTASTSVEMLREMVSCWLGSKSALVSLVPIRFSANLGLGCGVCGDEVANVLSFLWFETGLIGVQVMMELTGLTG